MREEFKSKFNKLRFIGVWTALFSLLMICIAYITGTVIFIEYIGYISLYIGAGATVVASIVNYTSAEKNIINHMLNLDLGPKYAKYTKQNATLLGLSRGGNNWCHITLALFHKDGPWNDKLIKLFFNLETEEWHIEEV